MEKKLYKVTEDVVCIIETNEKGVILNARAITKTQLEKAKVDIQARANADTTEVQAMLDVLK